MDTAASITPNSTVLPGRKSSGQDYTKCFHGFNVKNSEVTKSTFHFCEIIAERNKRLVYKAICKSERKCHLAIKQYSFTSPCSRKEYDTEEKAFEILRENPHKNFVEYYGSFCDGDNGYIVLELGLQTLSVYLRKYKDRLTITQVNNIAYQRFSMAKHMFDIGFIPADHGSSNIILCSDSLIKAIDFEEYTVRGSKAFDPQYRLIIIKAAEDCFLLQLYLKCIAETSCYEEARMYFYNRYVKKYFDDFTADQSLAFIADDTLWHKDISASQKDFFSKCFISDKEINQEFYHQLADRLGVFLPRERLLPF